MSLFSAARRGAWKCRWLIAGVCAAAAILPALSQGQRSDFLGQPAAPAEISHEQESQPPLPSPKKTVNGTSTDPVESIRLALLPIPVDRFGAPVKREDTIKSAIDNLKTITQLRKAYFLSDWPGAEPAPKLDLEKKRDSDLQPYRRQIGKLLTNAIKEYGEATDADKRISAAMWIADLAGAQEGEQRLLKIQFARSLTGIVVKLLEGKEVTVRQAALHALGRITPSPEIAFPKLKSTLMKDELGPRRVAAYAMIDLVSNATAQVRADATAQVRADEAIFQRRAEHLMIVRQVIATASISLPDPDESVRGYSLLAILEAAKGFVTHLELGEEVTVKLKEDAKLKLKEKTILDPDLQKIMANFKTTMPQLLEALADPKVKVRLAALQTLDQVCNARAKIVRDLQKFSAETDASRVLKEYEAPDPLGVIVEGNWTYITRLLKDDDERVRRGAIEFLEILGEQAEPALPEITQALRDPNPFVRWTAARTLRNVAGTLRKAPVNKVSHDAVRALAFLLMDPDPDVSKAAAETLEALGPAAADAVPELGYMIANADPANRAWDPENRLAAMKALASIPPALSKAAIPKLIAALADQDPRIRRQAAESLGLYGREAEAQSALPALRQAMRDDDGEVRLHASEAILNIKK